MNKDLVVINNESNLKSSEANEGLDSDNKSNYNLSHKNTNSVDYGNDSSANFNDDDYEADGEYSKGNFYQDDFNDYYSKGTVYPNDFTEDYPDINSRSKHKLYKDIRNIYQKDDKKSEVKEKNELEDLPLTYETSNKFFNLVEDEVEYEPGKILMKPSFFNAVNPEFKNANNLTYIYLSIVIGLASFAAIGNLRLAVPLFVISIFTFFASLINLLRTKHFLVLDYYKKEFYYETHTFLGNSVMSLFTFEDIAEIGVSYEEKNIFDYLTKDYEKYNQSIIIILLKNGKYFKLRDSGSFISEDTDFANYCGIAKNLSYALKKPYFDNPNKKVLRKSNDNTNGIHFSSTLNIGDPFCSFEVDEFDRKKAESTVGPLGTSVILIFGIIFVVYFVCAFL